MSHAAILVRVLTFVASLLSMLVAYAQLIELATAEARRLSEPAPIGGIEILSKAAAAPGGWRWLLVFLAAQGGLVWTFFSATRSLIG